MAYNYTGRPIGIQVSANGGANWYYLTDHNRDPISIAYELVESTQRMANGTLRKYVVARKFKITAAWKNLPTIESELVDFEAAARGAAWIKQFYETYAFSPVMIRLIYAKESLEGAHQTSSYTAQHPETAHVETSFMTSFSYEIIKRMPKYDYVNMSIEFTEI